MRPPAPGLVLRRLALWVGVSSAAGALIGLAVGTFTERGVERPTLIISVLFANVVGITAMLASTVLFARLERLSRLVRAGLVALALVTGSVAGTLLVLVAFPLFVFRDPRQALAVVLLNGLLALIVGGVVWSYEQLRQRLQRSLREVEEVRLVEAELREAAARAELAALQAHINPHFFFNTLNTISALIAEDAAAAERVVERLAELFRYTFRVAGAAPVPLAEELAFVRGYLSIESARFAERLRVAWDVEPAALAAEVPGLLLQPLVENAVAHAVAPRAAGGSVRIAAHCAGERLCVEVTDDGPGFARPAESLVRDGHGLANVRRRLEAVYRGAGRLDLGPNPAGRGALARLDLPRTPPARR